MKQTSDLIKRYSANNPQSSFGILSNLRQNSNSKKDSNPQNDHELLGSPNMSSSFEDNSQFYDKFLRTLQKSTHIKHQKRRETKKSSPNREIQIVDTNNFKEINKKEYGQRHSSYQNNNCGAIFSLNSKNISSHLQSNQVMILNPGHHMQSKKIKLSDGKRDSSHQENIKLETITNNINNSNEEDNKRMSKTIHINNSNSIKHSRTAKMSKGNNTNLRANSFDASPIQRKKKPLSVNHLNQKTVAQRNWFFCCLPFK